MRMYLGASLKTGERWVWRLCSIPRQHYLEFVEGGGEPACAGQELPLREKLQGGHHTVPILTCSLRDTLILTSLQALCGTRVLGFKGSSYHQCRCHRRAEV